MRLLTETTAPLRLITESEHGEKSHYLYGLFSKGNAVNRNGRVYPTDTLSEAIDRYHREFIDTDRALGTLGHDQEPEVNLHRAAIKIEGIQQHGHEFYGKAKILEHTQPGSQLLGLVRGGYKPGLSSRALGSVKPYRGGIPGLDEDHISPHPDSPIMEVQKDLRIMSYDCVHTPSVKGAVMHHLHEEKRSFSSLEGYEMPQITSRDYLIESTYRFLSSLKRHCR